jgi:hypothetical protein
MEAMTAEQIRVPSAAEKFSSYRPDVLRLLDEEGGKSFQQLPEEQPGRLLGTGLRRLLAQPMDQP